MRGFLISVPLAENARGTLLLLLAVSLTGVLLTIPRADVVASAQIRNDSSYLLYGTYHVFGEVLNTGDLPLRLIAITATFKDQMGRVVDVARSYVYSDVAKCVYLRPTEKAPFDVFELDSEKSARISSYTLTLEFQEAQTPFQNPLTVENVSNSTDSEGRLLVSGEVKNNGMETSKFPVVVGAFYDARGTVIYVYCPEEVFYYDEIPPGRAYNFTLGVPDAQISSRVRKYGLLAAAVLPLDHVVINEVEIGLQGGTIEEWSSRVELYNPTSVSVDLSGWTVRAERSHVTISMPQGTMIDPKGYQVSWLGAKVCLGCTERLTLRDSHGDEIDTTPWLDHIAISGFSWQRYPDGSDNWRSSPSTFQAMNIPELPSPAVSAAVILLACALVLRPKIRARGNCRH